MKKFNPYLVTAVMLLCFFICFTASAQDEKMLLKEGVALHDKGKYDEAIAKYQAALKLNPQYMNAEFEMAYSMYAGGKHKEALPHLEKVIAYKDDVELAAQATDIMGSIYDDTGEPDKAIETYQKGIKLNPKYQRLYYNIGISYYRLKKYAEAELSLIEAIKLDNDHASSQNAYAATLLAQRKDVYALMAYCNFLLLEPQTKRSGAAYQHIREIINSKVKVTGEKTINITLSNITNGQDKEASALEMALGLSAANVIRSDKSKTDMLQEQLTTLFKIAGELSEKKTGKDFFWKFYVDYFYLLAKSEHMPAFTRLVNYTENAEENIKWIKDNSMKLDELEIWMKNNPHKF